MNLGLTVLLLMKAYHIEGWEEERENADTRKYVQLLWYRNPVKLIGEGLGHTLSQPERRGPFLYGMFKLIEQVAAGGKKEERGWLYRNGSPMDAARIAMLLRLPEEFVKEALEFFSKPPMDWLKMREFCPNGPVSAGRTPGESPGNPGYSAGGRENTGRNAPSEPNEPNRTDLERTDQSILKEKEKEREASDVQIQASKVQAGILIGAIRELEARRATLTGEERAVLRKKRRELAELQKKQAGGDFKPHKAT